jgi:hypothetical protein
MAGVLKTAPRIIHPGAASKNDHTHKIKDGFDVRGLWNAFDPPLKAGSRSWIGWSYH